MIQYWTKQFYQILRVQFQGVYVHVTTVEKPSWHELTTGDTETCAHHQLQGAKGRGFMLPQTMFLKCPLF